MQNQGRPYQGYPYVNPVVLDAPSLDPNTAARWANLPRRPIGTPFRKVDVTRGEGSSNGTRIPEVPIHQARPSLPPKREPSDNPVVYIDLPENNGSNVVQNREDGQANGRPTFVEQTILYDPFENRRIDLSRGDESVRSGRSLKSDSDVDSVSDGSGPSTGRRPPIRPSPPHSLNFASGTQASQSNSSPGVPPFLSKEAYIYGRQPTPDDGFPLSPIPVSEFPEPPPAYTEIDRVSSPQRSEPTRNPQQELPRTQVIVPPPASDPTAVGMPHQSRKFLTCHHCRMRVHTLMVRETGFYTHAAALICLLFCLPLILVVYFTDYFKYKCHYCPNCNKLIGYILPIIGRHIIIVN